LKVLIEHIEKLLPDHDCVVVPGLGGFVQNEVPARFDAKSDMFYPGGKEICFNARLTFNDGFLAQSYQETFGLSFEESNLQIRQGVQEIMDKVNEGKYVSLGRIGVMWKNDQEQLAFRSENKNSFFPESYGLTPFTYPCLEKTYKKNLYTAQTTQKRKDDDFINIRLRRNSFRNFVTGAAACLVMLLLSKPAGDIPGTENQEAFMMHNYLCSSNVVSETNQADALPLTDEVIADTKTTSDLNPAENLATKEPSAVVQEHIKPEIINKEAEKPVQKAVQPSSPTRTYYIVISSFPQKRLAEEWIRYKGHGGIYKYSGIIEKDGRSRVYAKSFSDKNIAQSFLNKFRANNPEYASAWLLSSKNR